MSSERARCLVGLGQSHELNVAPATGGPRESLTRRLTMMAGAWVCVRFVEVLDHGWLWA